MTSGRPARRTAGERGGLWSALLTLVLMASAAFVVGGLVGLVWKQPGLLLAHLTGGTREVRWDAEADVAAPAPSAPAAPEASAPTPSAAAPREAAPAPPQASPPRTLAALAPAEPPVRPVRIAVQVGAFAERESAERLRGQLEQDGYPAYVAPGADSGSARWRVRVGPFATRGEADRVAARLKSARALPTWVLDEDAP